MGLKYTKRAMTSYEVHRLFHGLEISFFPDTLLSLNSVIICQREFQLRDGSYQQLKCMKNHNS